MKKTFILLLLSGFSFKAVAQKDTQVILAGFAGVNIIPKTIYKSELGFGLKGGAILGKFYVGGVLGVHSPSETSIKYSASIISSSGTQTYKTRALFVAADAGLHLPIDLGSMQTHLFFCGSLGIMNLNTATAGVYGSPSNLSQTKLAYGFMGSYLFSIGDHLAIGPEYRMYLLGDQTFYFGNNSSGKYEHGFSQSATYGALYVVVAYKF
jgi:hypothetical protein